MILERFSTDDFKDVYATAQMAHMGQTRRDGSEYFTHPSEVRDIAQGFYPADQVVQMAALLHDSLEDAPGSTVKTVEEMEEFIRGSIQDPAAGEEVIRVVRALTHEKGADYTSYVMGLMNDTPALRVKLADMVHNLSDAPRPKQKMKYKAALDAMGEKTGGAPPAGISSAHWEELYRLVEGKRMRISESQLRQIIRNSIKEMEQDPINEGLLSFLGDLFGGLVDWLKGQFQEAEQVANDVEADFKKGGKLSKEADEEERSKKFSKHAQVFVDNAKLALSDLSETDSVESWSPKSDKQEDVRAWRESSSRKGVSSLWNAWGSITGLLLGAGNYLNVSKALSAYEKGQALVNKKPPPGPAPLVKNMQEGLKILIDMWSFAKDDLGVEEASNVLSALQSVQKKSQEVLGKIAADAKKKQKNESIRKKNNLRLTESELRLIIQEEIGRSFSTNADGPIPYWKTVADDVLVTVMPIEAGSKYACEIEVPSNPELSSPMRYFPTEEEANHFARQYTEKVKNFLFNEQA